MVLRNTQLCWKVIHRYHNQNVYECSTIPASPCAGLTSSGDNSTESASPIHTQVLCSVTVLLQYTASLHLFNSAATFGISTVERFSAS